ncbi:phosphotransferase family protein [Pseudonocardia ailaonensis]|uniref:Phosphotransferase family protein n=1 Tax=Pseudonocardia ailaonensis TaxID=367279 RepID=A0ABN2N4G2_9PSEU
MPVAADRDLRTAATRLGEWLDRSVPELAGREVLGLRVPAASGFSHETLVAELTGATIVVRIARPEHRICPDADLGTESAVLCALGSGGLPVPRVYGREPDPEVLGGPFLVQQHLAGDVPADLPSYHREGWLHGLRPGQREALWWGAVDALAVLHRTATPVIAALAPVDDLDDLERHLDFYRCADEPVVHGALDWARAYPPPAAPTRLLWGDARLGNIVFRGTAVGGLLDWELTGTGSAETDLAWFVHLDRHLSEGIGAPRLDGFPSTTATVRHYERRSGRPVTGFSRHLVRAALRFAATACRVTSLLVEARVVEDPLGFPLRRNALVLLHRTLAEAGEAPDDDWRDLL